MTSHHRALQAVAVQQCEVSGDVGRVCVEVEEGEREVGRVRRERAESQARCRELVAQIEVRTRWWIWSGLPHHSSVVEKEQLGLLSSSLYTEGRWVNSSNA